MPELPEVETIRRGISPHIKGMFVSGLQIRQPKLRWPIPQHLTELLPGQQLKTIGRRGKYLLLSFEKGTLIIHLGMSGSLRVLDPKIPPQKHDHFDLCFQDGAVLRLRDPRRFGAILWTEDTPMQHSLLKDLGPEPLEEGFDGDLLHQRCRHRHAAIKQCIMDSKNVVGVGNIYANESLFRAGIHPARSANRLSRLRYLQLAQSIVSVLQQAIRQGGTTLRDFQQEDGRPGYFAQELQVYGKIGQPCPQCGTIIKHRTLGQRATYYCPNCQR